GNRSDQRGNTSRPQSAGGTGQGAQAARGQTQPKRRAGTPRDSARGSARLPPPPVRRAAGLHAQRGRGRRLRASSDGSPGVTMYLIDTDVLSESRKGDAANVGVQEFFRNATRDDVHLYLSVITIGELRRGLEAIRHRGDKAQADRLESWLERVTIDYSE